MGVINQILQILIILTPLVALHEFGHFITAKIFKMRVEKFYIFFDFLFPLQNVGNFALFKKKKGDTEYGLGWFPLGGYVKISGMVDESMDVDALNEPAKPWEFRAKPAWQRLIVMLGGIIMNVLTGIAIFVGMIYAYGEAFVPAKEVKYGIFAHPLAEEMGLKTFDKITKINGKDYVNFDDTKNIDIILGSNGYYTIERDGKNIDIKIPNNLAEKLGQQPFIDPVFKFKVGEVIEGTPASKAGLLKDDEIIKVDSTPINFYHELKAALTKKASKEVKVAVLRNNKTQILDVTVTPQGTIGFFPISSIKEDIRKYSFGTALILGTEKALSIVFVQIKAFQKMFKGELDPTKSVRGVVGITKSLPTQINWPFLLGMCGLFSMGLAFMNLLPIPALDGGHVIFLIYEMIARRAPSQKFMENAQRVGMMLLLSLMVFTLFNDIFNF